MKTMRKASPLLLLLGLAVAHACCGPSIPAAPVDTYHYIVKPTEMTPEDKKFSKVSAYIDATAKYEDRKIEVEGLKKEEQEADKKLKDLVLKIDNGKQAAANDGQKVKDLADALAKAKTAHQAAKDALAKEKKASYDKAKDGDDEKAWKSQHDAAVKMLTTAVEATQAAEEKVDKLHKEWDGIKKEYDANWGDDEENKWNSDKKEDTDKLKPWAKLRRDLRDALKKATHKKERVEGGQYYEEDANGKKKQDKDNNDIPLKPEDGGMAYWKDKKNAEDPNTNLHQIEARPDTGFNGEFKVLGFYKDVHGTELLVSSDQKLDEVKKLFAYTVAKSDGNPEEKKVFAEVTEVKEADKEKTLPSVSGTSFLKMNKGVKAVKNHLAMIGELTVQVEEIKGVMRDMKNDKGEVIKTGADDKQKNKQEPVPRFYLNFQMLGALVYTGPTVDVIQQAHLFRGSDDYDVIGDFTDVSDAKAITQGSSGADAKGKDGGSNTWMVVAIIFIVIVVLGGLVLGYQAYNASGSLQNTDI